MDLLWMLAGCFWLAVNKANSCLKLNLGKKRERQLYGNKDLLPFHHSMKFILNIQKF